MRLIGPPITDDEKRIAELTKETIFTLNEMVEIEKDIECEVFIKKYDMAVHQYLLDETFKIKKTLTNNAIKSKVRLRNRNKEKVRKMLFERSDIFYAGYSDAFVNINQKEMFTGDELSQYLEGYEAGLIMREEF